MRLNNAIDKITDLKLAELKKFLPVLLLAPYTRVILLAGSVAAGHPKPASDIDLIIISQNNRVWLNRFFLEILTRALKIRRTKNNFNNKICFNIFVSNREPLLPHRDAVGASFYKNLKPVWGSDKEIKNFWQTNLWIKNFIPIPTESFRSLFSKKSSLIKIILEKTLDYTGLGWLMEKIAYRSQLSYLRHRLKQTAIDPNSSELDFYVTPQLIAYHFPISNYARAKKHTEATVENNPALEK